MDDNLRAQLAFEAQKKSVGAAYLLWFFLGLFGAHRFYLGRKGTGIAQLLMCLSIVGIIPLAFWWVVDAFRIPRIAEGENMKTIERIEGQRVVAERKRGEREHRRLAQERSRPHDPRVEEIRAMSRR